LIVHIDADFRQRARDDLAHRVVERLVGRMQQNDFLAGIAGGLQHRLDFAGRPPQHLSVSAQVVDDLTWGMMKARS
jgi:hypothetical protein